MNQRIHNNRFALFCLIAFGIVFLLLAIEPSHRDDWLLENLIVFIGVPGLLAMHWHLPLSRISYALILAFLCMHEVGSHYTYSEVPYDRWTANLFGTGLNDMLGWERNHYDRLVHLVWGLFLTYPIREIVLRVSQARGFWAYLLPFLIVISTSTIYELLEWLAALVFGGDLGIAYLGTQGDIWDAQKDMALALAGSLLATLLIGALNAILDRDFAREWNESLRVKHAEPLGEYEIARLMSERDEHDDKR